MPAKIVVRHSLKQNTDSHEKFMQTFISCVTIGLKKAKSKPRREWKQEEMLMGACQRNNIYFLMINFGVGKLLNFKMENKLFSFE